MKSLFLTLSIALTMPMTALAAAPVELISEGAVKKLGEGASQVLKTASTGVNHLTAEAINLFIFQGLVHLLWYAVIFVIFYIVKKYIDFLKESGMSEKMCKALTVSALIISVTFFTTKSMPHIMELTKAIVAPNIFLLEKGAEFVKDFNK